MQHAMAICEHLERTSSATAPNAANWDFDIPRVVGAAAGRLGDDHGAAAAGHGNAPCWWVVNAAGRRGHGVNGIYYPISSLPRYSGVQPYLRGASAVELTPALSTAPGGRRAAPPPPARSMALLQCNRREWVLSDLGTELCDFSESQRRYSSESDGAFPPTDGWCEPSFSRSRGVSRGDRPDGDPAGDCDEDGGSADGEGGGAVPSLRMLGGSCGWICRLTVFGVPINEKVRELERLLADVGQHGGQQRARVAQELQGLRMAVASLSEKAKPGAGSRSQAAGQYGSDDGITASVHAARCENYEFCTKNEEFCIQTRNCVSKKRNCVSKLMNSAGSGSTPLRS